VTSSDALREALDEMAASTDRLLATVDQLDDPALREPSMLPDWTRGHVLTHVARNADGLANLVVGARTGEPREMYAGGREGRAAEIAAGADRHIGDIRLDVADSADRLLEAFADFPDEALGREVTMTSGASMYGWEIPVVRVREVEIHHVDVAAGYTPADWGPQFAVRTLDQLAPLFRDSRDCPVSTLVATDGKGRWQVAAGGPELEGTSVDLVAWLVGRSPGTGLRLSSAGEVPPAPPWT
jgi:maleylpyruvate isomerase